MILEPEYLDRIYQYWLSERFSVDPYLYKTSYQHQKRTSIKNQRFEDWLFFQGFTIVQREKKRYLKFSGDDRRLTFFLLKHGVTA